MAPRDHRIHLGRRNSLKNPPQNHSSTKQLFPGPFFAPQKLPNPKCRPKISPEADFGNFSKSLQQVRTANPSEILSRIHPSKLQTEPRGEKHVCFFCVFSCKNQKFGVGALPGAPKAAWALLGIRSDSGLHFPRTCCKTIVFYMVWEPAWYTKPDPPDPADPAEMVHSWQFAP